MAIGTHRNALIEWIMWLLVFSVVFTGIFWCFFEDCTTQKEIYSIFGTTMGIGGLWIAIDQIARIRNEKEIIQITTVKTHLSEIKRELEFIQSSINSEVIGQSSLRNWINTLTDIENKILGFNTQDKIPCDRCIQLVVTLLNELNDEIIQDNFVLFRRAYYSHTISHILNEVNGILSTLNNNDV